MCALLKPLSILLTNDDGIHAEGLWALYRALQGRHNVTVIAPDRERSAVGHGITLHRPLRTAQVTVNGGFKGWAVNGTPADCIKLAVLELLKGRPDLVISGINPGANVGVNLNYSGTVAAAKEAAIYGLNAMAVSIQGAVKPYYESAAEFVARVAPLVNSRGLPRGTFLNINVPNMPSNRIGGVRLSHQGTEIYDEYIDKRQDPRNRTYYWQGGESMPPFSHDQSDGAVLSADLISITPVRCDMTDYDALEELRTWNLDNGYGASPRRR